MPVVTYAFASLMDTRRPATRVRRVVDGPKTCAFCGVEYPQRPHERPERHCCSKPACETAWEAAKRRTDHARKTPRPMLNEPPRPLRTGNS